MSRNVPLFIVALLACMVAALEFTPVAFSDDGPAASRSAASSDKSVDEKAALAFAAEHHPELATLIRQLRRTNPDAYQKAVQDLSRTRDRLARLQGRFPDRYEGELALWKLDSRIRLLAAQSAMSDEDSRQEQIRKLLLQRADLRLKQLEQERARVAARLKRLDRSIEDLKTRRPELVDRELNALLKSARSRAAQKRTTPRRTPRAEKPAARGARTNEAAAAAEKPGRRNSTDEASRKQSGQAEPR